MHPSPRKRSGLSNVHGSPTNEGDIQQMFDTLFPFSLSLSLSLSSSHGYYIGSSLLVFRNAGYSLYNNVLFEGNVMAPKEHFFGGFVVKLLYKLTNPWINSTLKDEVLSGFFRICMRAYRAIDISRFETQVILFGDRQKVIGI